MKWRNAKTTTVTTRLYAQWDGTKWVKGLRLDAAHQDKVRPMIEEAAKDYSSRRILAGRNALRACDKSS